MEQHLIKKKCPVCNRITVVDINVSRVHCVYCGVVFENSELNNSKSNNSEIDAVLFENQVLSNILAKDSLQKEWDSEVKIHTLHFVESIIEHIEKSINSYARKEEFIISNNKKLICGETEVGKAYVLSYNNKELMCRVFPDIKSMIPKVKTDCENVYLTTYDGEYICYGKLLKFTKRGYKGDIITTTQFGDLIIKTLIEEAKKKKISVKFKGIKIVSKRDMKKKDVILSRLMFNDKLIEVPDSTYTFSKRHTIIIPNDGLINKYIAGLYEFRRKNDNATYDYSLCFEYCYELD